MSSANYPKEARLHRPSEFAQVFSHKRATRGALFTLHYCPNSVERARLGIIIAKRNAALSVTRSTIKRVIREVFRLHQHQLYPKDYVVRLHRHIEPCSLRALRKMVRTEIISLFEKQLEQK
ncbi:ribonuclease P protein component [Pelistega sp. NLN82]|uniref:Ribonuclease P protein component n=1 Tax=Pelistega ratti TaxID=2652177 RepID=A0A6L9Y485_9BURK|nr:ribonuclease P protein component [Pelistega ratti]NEN75262.1 ribonuclease P protein component [Pelistega ratti]